VRVESPEFLTAIDKAVSAELDVHLVYDNLATYKTAAARTEFGWFLGADHD
jgi:hypothetical protein